MSKTSGEKNIANLEVKLNENQAVFYGRLKEFLIEEKVEGAELYYYLILENPDIIDKVLEYKMTHDLELFFGYEVDKNPYGYGEDRVLKILFMYKKNQDDVSHSLRFSSVHYELKLDTEDRYWGYCECSPEDEGYDARYGCCGTKNCDASFPRILPSIVESLGAKTFDGNSKLKWEITDEWNQTTQLEIEKDKKKALEDYYDSQITHFQNMKENLYK